MKYSFNQFLKNKLACPTTKQVTNQNFYNVSQFGYPEALVTLPNSPGFKDWEGGQSSYEGLQNNFKYRRYDDEYHDKLLNFHLNEIQLCQSIYNHFPLHGEVLDIGGGPGLVREFLKEPDRLISVDPFPDPLQSVSKAKIQAYTCLQRPLNFVQGNAEFLPFLSRSFDCVHMRSMLDHVQVPDLALLEAHRVLKEDGYLVIGMSVTGGKDGKKKAKKSMKKNVEEILGAIGLTKFKDHHTWHPTYSGLLSILQQNKFEISDVFWQPGFDDKVVYVKAKPL